MFLFSDELSSCELWSWNGLALIVEIEKNSHSPRKKVMRKVIGEASGKWKKKKTLSISQVLERELNQWENTCLWSIPCGPPGGHRRFVFIERGGRHVRSWPYKDLYQLQSILRLQMLKLYSSVFSSDMLRVPPPHIRCRWKLFQSWNFLVLSLPTHEIVIIVWKIHREWSFFFFVFLCKSMDLTEFPFDDPKVGDTVAVTTHLSMKRRRR